MTYYTQMKKKCRSTLWETKSTLTAYTGINMSKWKDISYVIAGAHESGNAYTITSKQF